MRYVRMYVRTEGGSVLAAKDELLSEMTPRTVRTVQYSWIAQFPTKVGP